LSPAHTQFTISEAIIPIKAITIAEDKQLKFYVLIQ